MWNWGIRWFKKPAKQMFCAESSNCKVECMHKGEHDVSFICQVQCGISHKPCRPAEETDGTTNS